MSLIPYYSFDLNDYKTREDIEDLLREIENEQSILRGYQRGAKEKLATMPSESLLDEDE